MSVTKLPYGKPVKLLIDLQGFSDGRLVLFEIWRKKSGNEEKVTEVYGVTKGGKGVGRWIPLIEREEVLPLQKKIKEQVEEEKFYFIAKIDDKEIKSGDMLFTYLLDISLQDMDDMPVDSVKYKVTFADGSEKEGEFKNGHAKFEDAPTGKFNIELKDYEFVFGFINSVAWGKNKAKIGEKVKMVVDVRGFENGTPAKFEIWEEDFEGKKEKIEEIEGEVQDNKVEAVWIYSPEKQEEDLKQSVEEEVGESKFFFVTKIKDEEVGSDFLTFTYPLEIRLEDEDGNLLDDVDYTLILSDGTRITGKVKEGYIKIEAVPYGKFTLKVRGYD